VDCAVAPRSDPEERRKRKEERGKKKEAKTKRQETKEVWFLPFLFYLSSRL
jgi:hypothetical protein